MVKVKEDITGWKMSEHGVIDSRWTVIKQVEDYINPSGQHFAQYLCECSCEQHNQKVVSANNLKGASKSCGCLRIERHYNKEKEYNEYDYSREYGVGFCHNTGKEFYFDWADFDIIKEYCWSECLSQNRRYHYLVARRVIGSGLIRMSDLLGFKHYDHKNRNPLDNRRDNFRKATAEENGRNHTKRIDNTSGVTGVTWNKKSGMWQVRISVDKHEQYLGMFSDKELAIKTRLVAEKQCYGEFAPQQHLFEKYGIVSITTEGDNNIAV